MCLKSFVEFSPAVLEYHHLVCNVVERSIDNYPGIKGYVAAPGPSDVRAYDAIVVM